MEEQLTTKREPVNYNYATLNWNFIKGLAEIAQYAEAKYGSTEQYRHTRLTGEKAPLNHLLEHYRAYLAGESHDRFGDPVYHLYAMAYNVMMEFYYHTNFGHQPSLLTGPKWHPEPVGKLMGEMDAAAEKYFSGTNTIHEFKTEADRDAFVETIANEHAVVANDLGGLPEQNFLGKFLSMVGGNRK